MSDSANVDPKRPPGHKDPWACSKLTAEETLGENRETLKPDANCDLVLWVIDRQVIGNMTTFRYHNVHFNQPCGPHGTNIHARIRAFRVVSPETEGTCEVDGGRYLIEKIVIKLGVEG